MNMYNEKYIEYITPFLKDFWKAESDNYTNSHYPYGLFLPHVFDSYQNSKKKIFYIGQDAFYWIDGNKMKELFNDNKFEEYIRQNNEVMASVNKKLAWGNSAGAFWTMVIKLHLYINTGKWLDISKLGNEYNKLIQSIGYGNVYSLALKHTIETFGDGSDIDYNKYGEVKDYLFREERLKPIIDIFEPDYVIILCRNLGPYQEENYFKGLNISFSEDDELDQYIYTSNLVGKSHCKVIWCPNPNYYRFLGTNMREMAELIKNNVCK